MITTGRFERSNCYWAKYHTLSGEERLLHASLGDIKMWAAKQGSTEITSHTINIYFHSLIKSSVNSATYGRNNAKIPKVRLARAKASA